jgi:hypothetical protein
MSNVATSSHGRWYTRTIDDPITGVADESPGVAGAVDTSWSRDLYDLNTPAAGVALTSTPIVPLPYNDWPPVNPPNTLELRMAP